MGISSNPMLQAESDCQRIEFIKNDLAMCSTFTTLATMKYEAGNWNSAERSLGHAEGTYAALLPLVSDPTYAKHLTSQQVLDFTAELERLREKLDGLQRFRK
jgi:hypothetical protein